MQELLVSIRIERRWPLQLALILAGIWLAAAVLGMASHLPSLPDAAVRVAPPLGLALVIYAMLASDPRPLALADVEARLAEAREQLNGFEAALARVDDALAGTSGQLRELAAAGAAALPAMAADADALQQAAGRIAASGEAADRATAALRAALPDIARTVGAVGETLRDVGGESATQLRAVETMLAAVRARNNDAAVEADAAIANMAALLARIDEGSTRNTAALSKRAFALDAAIDGVLERSANAVGQINEQVDAQMRSFAAGIEATAKQLQIFGDDGARLFNQRIDALLKTSAQLAGELDAHDAAVISLHGAASGRFGDMQQQLGGMAAAGTESLDAINDRMVDFEARLAVLNDQLGAAHSALGGMDAQAGKFMGTVIEVDTILVERLAATRAASVALDAEAGRMLDAVGTLGDASADSAGMLAQAAGAIAAQRDAIVELGETLASHFETARATLADIREDTTVATVAAADDFGAGLARVREAASETAADIREMLVAVVDIAIAALQSAASGGSDAAFGGPVRVQLAAIEETTARATEVGQELSRRLAAQMVALVETVAAAEARIDDVETRFALRERGSMAAQSMRIMGQLDTALVDVAKLLAIPVGEDDWARYLRGDRGAFARAVVPLLDRDMSRRLARLFAHDESFRHVATVYIQEFESLINRLLGDRDGESLAAIMLSSDIGKIYVAIAEAAERLPPARQEVARVAAG